MRAHVLGLSLIGLLTACGTDSGEPPPGDDDGGGDGSDMLPAPDRGFQIVTPEVAIPRGTEITYCYYFKTPNTETLPIKSWQSHMTAGSHHMILYTTKAEIPAPGTIEPQKLRRRRCR